MSKQNAGALITVAASHMLHPNLAQAFQGVGMVIADEAVSSAQAVNILRRCADLVRLERDRRNLVAPYVDARFRPERSYGAWNPETAAFYAAVSPDTGANTGGFLENLWELDMTDAIQEPGRFEQIAADFDRWADTLAESLVEPEPEGEEPVTEEAEETTPAGPKRVERRMTARALAEDGEVTEGDLIYDTEAEAYVTIHSIVRAVGGKVYVEAQDVAQVEDSYEIALHPTKKVDVQVTPKPKGKKK